VRHVVALEVPLGPLSLGRILNRDNATDTRIESLRDALDNPTLAGRIPTFEEHRNLLRRGCALAPQLAHWA